MAPRPTGGFPAGTLVSTEDGLEIIEYVTVGTRVLTHRGRFRPVTARKQSVSDTIFVCDHDFWLETAPSSPFYTRKRIDGRHRHPTWMAASDIDPHADRWAAPSEFPDVEIPPLPPPAIDLAFWKMLGAWICDATSDPSRVSHEVTDVSLDWLDSHFGETPDERRVPAWIFSIDERYRRAFLSSFDRGGVETSSKQLAVGFKLLACSVGYYRASFSRRYAFNSNIEPDVKRFLADWWNLDMFSLLAFQDKLPVARTDGCLVWSDVTHVRPSRKNAIVYGIRVEEDESFVADGMVVGSIVPDDASVGAFLASGV